MIIEQGGAPSELRIRLNLNERCDAVAANKLREFARRGYAVTEESHPSVRHAWVEFLVEVGRKE